MLLFLKALIGGGLVVAISLLSSTKHYYLSGLLPLFPTFALIAHVMVAQVGTNELKNTALFGMLSLIPYFFYLLSVYLLSEKLNIVPNLLVSVLVWFVFAFAIYWFWNNMIITQ